MENKAFLFIGIWIILVIALVIIIQLATAKRRKSASEKRRESVKTQLHYLQDRYIKDAQVKFAYANSNDSMCRRADEKVKAVAKNIAKAAIRTTITGRASYRGSDVNQRDYIIGYGKQMYYFFRILDARTAQELCICEEDSFSISKDDIKNIIMKDRKQSTIYLDLKDASRIGFKMNNKILTEIDFTSENEGFLDYMQNEISLIK